MSDSRFPVVLILSDIGDFVSHTDYVRDEITYFTSGIDKSMVSAGNVMSAPYTRLKSRRESDRLGMVVDFGFRDTFDDKYAALGFKIEPRNTPACDAEAAL